MPPARPMERPPPAAHASLPAQRMDHDRALQDQLLSTLIPKRNRPAALAIKSFKRVDKVAVESESAKLAIGYDIDARLLLKLDRRPDGGILDRLELGVCHLARVQPLSSVDQLRWSQKAADDLGSPRLQVGRHDFTPPPGFLRPHQTRYWPPAHRSRSPTAEGSPSTRPP